MVTRASDEFAILARRRRPMRHARRTPPSEAGAPARTQDAARPATCSAAGAREPRRFPTARPAQNDSRRPPNGIWSIEMSRKIRRFRNGKQFL
nr:hypothetical protein [Burkholderia pseudomallei]